MATNFAAEPGDILFMMSGRENTSRSSAGRTRAYAYIMDSNAGIHTSLAKSALQKVKVLFRQDSVSDPFPILAG